MALFSILESTCIEKKLHKEKYQTRFLPINFSEDLRLLLLPKTDFYFDRYRAYGLRYFTSSTS